MARSRSGSRGAGDHVQVGADRPGQGVGAGGAGEADEPRAAAAHDHGDERRRRGARARPARGRGRRAVRARRQRGAALRRAEAVGLPGQAAQLVLHLRDARAQAAGLVGAARVGADLVQRRRQLAQDDEPRGRGPLGRGDRDEPAGLRPAALERGEHLARPTGLQRQVEVEGGQPASVQRARGLQVDAAQLRLVADERVEAAADLRPRAVPVAGGPREPGRDGAALEAQLDQVRPARRGGGREHRLRLRPAARRRAGPRSR